MSNTSNNSNSSSNSSTHFSWRFRDSGHRRQRYRVPGHYQPKCVDLLAGEKGAKEKAGSCVLSSVATDDGDGGDDDDHHGGGHFDGLLGTPSTFRRSSVSEWIRFELLQRIHSYFAVLIYLTGLLILGIIPTFGQVFPCGADGICVCSGQEVGQLVPDCEDCTSYYLCGNGFAQKVKCNSGMIFDINLKTCVNGQCPRLDGTCSGSVTPTPTPGTPGTPGETPSTPGPSGPCANDVTCRFAGEFIAHPQHCRFFYTCIEKCPVLGFCELGKWFDRELFVCDYPQKVKNCPSNRD
ncbi:uncharacterized protein LOC122320905 [Drosophila ficusphila]|uniref:uncharacterized protein LOC122320905 n=1 Tax=Drosophila ficusphila TaxID=30025 RepID=UPI001C895A25|nr:uncharacterized protein LOC122320905 [Drosophila ficusphila]